jgi:hypothetical protein
MVLTAAEAVRPQNQPGSDGPGRVRHTAYVRHHPAISELQADVQALIVRLVLKRTPGIAEKGSNAEYESFLECPYRHNRNCYFPRLRKQQYRRSDAWELICGRLPYTAARIRYIRIRSRRLAEECHKEQLDG